MHSEDLQHLIPQHKHDLAAVQRAAAAGFPAVEPVLPALLEWMQDANWPVARELEPLLIKNAIHLTPFILEVLRGKDCIWKYSVLTHLIVEFPRSAIEPLVEECLRIVNEPTACEISEEVDLAARDILILYNYS